MSTPDGPVTIPKHIAVIMDGNGRWARKRGLPRVEGHKAGAESVRRIVAASADFGIEYLTLYAFSTENWKRPPGEVGRLMQLLATFLDERLEELTRHRIRLLAIGETERLPAFARSRLERVMAATREFDRGTLILALNYGARAEIVRAARALAEKTRAGTIDPAAITEELLADHLDTAGIPDPDLIIRTAGEQRLSNFLLWQASYAEFWFTPVQWPDFDKSHLQQAIEEFSRRKRRFGGLDHA
jgi:undecaprenyl diphosphate synthase